MYLCTTNTRANDFFCSVTCACKLSTCEFISQVVWMYASECMWVCVCVYMQKIYFRGVGRNSIESNACLNMSVYLNTMYIWALKPKITHRYACLMHVYTLQIRHACVFAQYIQCWTSDFYPIYVPMKHPFSFIFPPMEASIRLHLFRWKHPCAFGVRVHSDVQTLFMWKIMWLAMRISYGHMSRSRAMDAGNVWKGIITALKGMYTKPADFSKARILLSSSLTSSFTGRMNKNRVLKVAISQHSIGKVCMQFPKLGRCKCLERCAAETSSQHKSQRPAHGS